MGREKGKQVSAFMVVWMAAFISQNLVMPVMANTIQDQKNYYGTPVTDPHAGSHRTPSHGHGNRPSHSSGSHGTTPSHGSGGYGSTPPSHGGGGSYNPTPSNPPTGNCGTPVHAPSTPRTPSDPHSGGGGYHHSPPTSGGGYNPSPPSHGGGGGYNPSPPSSGGGYNPSPPSYGGGGGGYNPSPPSSGGGYNPPTPTTPIVDPGTPTTPVPTPPFFPTPSSPFTGTCNYWRTHPGIIWGLLGWWGTLGSAFGLPSGAPGFGATATVSLPEALSNTRTDGLGSLYREGTAAFLNSMVNSKFPFTTKQVRDRFVAALGSNKAAESLAKVFKNANEGHLQPRA